MFLTVLDTAPPWVTGRPLSGNTTPSPVIYWRAYPFGIVFSSTQNLYLSLPADTVGSASNLINFPSGAIYGFTAIWNCPSVPDVAL